MRNAVSVVAMLLPTLLSSVMPNSAEDAVFKRRSSASEAEALSKQIAKQVGCEVCVLASKLIVQSLHNQTFKSEPQLLEVIEALCKGRSGQEPIDRVLERAGWAIEGDEGSGFKLEQREELSSETATLHDLENRFTLLKGGEESLGQYKRDSLQEACVLSVSEYQSELSEYLFKRIMRKSSIDDKVVAQKLCLELSGVCLLKKPVDGTGRREDEIEEWDGSIDDEEIVDEHSEEEDSEEGEVDEGEGEGEDEDEDDDEDGEEHANQDDMEEDPEAFDSELAERHSEEEGNETIGGPNYDEGDDEEMAYIEEGQEDDANIDDEDEGIEHERAPFPDDEEYDEDEDGEAADDDPDIAQRDEL